MISWQSHEDFNFDVGKLHIAAADYAAAPRSTFKLFFATSIQGSMSHAEVWPLCTFQAGPLVGALAKAIQQATLTNQSVLCRNPCSEAGGTGHQLPQAAFSLRPSFVPNQDWQTFDDCCCNYDEAGGLLRRLPARSLDAAGCSRYLFAVVCGSHYDQWVNAEQLSGQLVQLGS